MGLLLVAGWILVPPGTAQVTTETQRFVGANDELQDFFGAATAVADGWLFVGAYNEPPPDDPSAPWGGAVYVYRRELGGWKPTQTLGSPSPTKASFGRFLQVSDDLLVVGDPVDFWAGSGAGKIHVFELENGSWIHRQELVSRSPGIGHGFGSAIDVDGDRIVVGEPGEDSGAPAADNGAVYVFDRGSTGWELTQFLLPEHREDFEAPSGFGGWVSLSGGRLVSFASSNGTSHVQVFELGPNGWEHTAFLHWPEAPSHDDFGKGLSLDGDWLAVSDPANAGIFTPRFGKVILFEFTGSEPGDWKLRQTLIASNASAGSNTFNTDSFGYSTDLRGDRLLVGAKYGFSGHDHPYGQAYLFERSAEGHWTETQRFSTERAERGQEEAATLGTDVALLDSIVVAGAMIDFGRSGEVRSGAAYVYELPLGESACPGAANSTGKGASLTLTGVARADRNGVNARAEDLPAGEPALLLASRSDAPPTTPPGSQGTLCLGGPILRLAHTLGASSKAGDWSSPLDLPQAGIDVQPGDTWSFQLWYRDSNPQPTSNLSNSVRLTWH